MKTKFNNSFLSSKRKLSTVMLASFLWSSTLFAAPMTISASGVPTTTGSNSVGTVALWTNAGTIGGEFIDLRATVIAYNGTTLTFETVGDDPSLLLSSSAKGDMVT